MNLDYTLLDKEELRRSDVVGVNVRVSNKDYDQSIVICASMDMAEYERRMLYENRICPYVATAQYVTRFKDDYRLGAVLIERVCTLDTWIEKNPNLKFWVSRTSTSGVKTYISTDVDLRKLCCQVCKALRCIHENNGFHDNITDGIMIGTDNNVRVCNFRLRNQDMNQFSEPRIAEGQREDVGKLVVVVEKIVNLPGGPGKRQTPLDLQRFLDMCELCIRNVPKTIDEFRGLSKWVYNAPLFWKPGRVIYFFDNVNEHIDENFGRLSKCGFLHMYSDWANTLRATREQTFCNCLSYHGSKSEYSAPFGILRFIQNYKEYYKEKWMTDVEAVKKVTDHFSYLLEEIYLELMRIKDVPLSVGGVTKTMDTIMWENPSVFDMDDCC